MTISRTQFLYLLIGCQLIRNFLGKILLGAKDIWPCSQKLDQLFIIFIAGVVKQRISSEIDSRVDIYFVVIDLYEGYKLLCAICDH